MRRRCYRRRAWCVLGCCCVVPSRLVPLQQEAMAKVLAKVTLKESGKFFDHEGFEHDIDAQYRACLRCGCA